VSKVNPFQRRSRNPFTRRKQRDAPETQLGRSISQIFGAPMDMVQKGLALGLTGKLVDAFLSIGMVNALLGGIGGEQPFLGSESLMAMQRKLGIGVATQDPETLAERVYAGIGSAAGALVPIVKGGQMLGRLKSALPLGRKAARTAVNRAGETVQSMRAPGQQLSSIGETISKPFLPVGGTGLPGTLPSAARSLIGPAASVGTELLAGAGAGAGEHAAETVAPDNELAAFIGSITGGVGAAMSPALAVKSATLIPRLVLKGIRASYEPFTTAGGLRRASSRAQDVAGSDLEHARMRLGTQETGIADLTPAQRTGNKKLLALERDVLETDAGLSDEYAIRTSKSTQQLRDAIGDLGIEDDIGIEDAQKYIGQRLQYLSALLDQRVLQAQERAAQRIGALAPKRRLSESAKIVQEELDLAMKAARKQETEAWEATPYDSKISTANGRAVYNRLVKDTARPFGEDIPPIAKKFLQSVKEEAAEAAEAGTKKGGKKPKSVAFKEQEEVKQVHALYSKLREAARKARSAEDFKAAGFADEVADGVWEDLKVVPALDDARAFSLKLNQTFKQGRVGKLLGYERAGGRSVAPELILDASVGSPGIKGLVQTEDLMKALDFAGEHNIAADDAIQDYITRQFINSAAPEGKLNPKSAATFLKRNEELLENFPDLKKKFTDAKWTQEQAEFSQGRSTVLKSEAQTRAGILLNTPMEQEFKAMMKSSDPAEAARVLMRTVGKDKTGVAKKGLKSGYLRYLLDSVFDRVDDKGRELISGNALTKMLREGRSSGVIDEFLTKGERRRLEMIAKEFQLLERARGKLPAIGGAVADLPSSVLQFIAGSIGAHGGGWLGGKTTGASLRIAGKASTFLERIVKTMTKDRAVVALQDAILDDKLFASMLIKIGPKTKPSVIERIERSLGAWMTGYTGYAVGEQQQGGLKEPVQAGSEQPDPLGILQ